MDRISAIRNVEDALRAFENGDADLADTERRVAAVLRTYATEFDGDDDVFRVLAKIRSTERSWSHPRRPRRGNACSRAHRAR